MGASLIKNEEFQWVQMANGIWSNSVPPINETRKVDNLVSLKLSFEITQFKRVTFEFGVYYPIYGYKVIKSFYETPKGENWGSDKINRNYGANALVGINYYF